MVRKRGRRTIEAPGVSVRDGECGVLVGGYPSSIPPIPSISIVISPLFPLLFYTYTPKVSKNTGFNPDLVLEVYL